MSTLHDPAWRGFASDNYAGVHPEVLEALAAANGGHQVAYGADVCSTGGALGLRGIVMVAGDRTPPPIAAAIATFFCITCP